MLIGKLATFQSITHLDLVLISLREWDFTTLS